MKGLGKGIFFLFEWLGSGCWGLGRGFDFRQQWISLEDSGQWDGFGCGVWGRRTVDDFRRWAANLEMDSKRRWVDDNHDD